MAATPLAQRAALVARAARAPQPISTAAAAALQPRRAAQVRAAAVLLAPPAPGKMAAVLLVSLLRVGLAAVALMAAHHPREQIHQIRAVLMAATEPAALAQVLVTPALAAQAEVELLGAAVVVRAAGVLELVQRLVRVAPVGSIRHSTPRMAHQAVAGVPARTP